MSKYAKISVVEAAAVQNIISYTEHPFGRGNLTTTAGQYSAEVIIPSTQGTTDITIQNVTIDPDCDGTIKQLYFNLVGQLKAATSTTANMTIQWQARNNGGTWVNLHSLATKAAIGAVYVEDIYQGYVDATTNLNRMPIDIQLKSQINESTQGFGRVSSTSYVTIQYVAD